MECEALTVAELLENHSSSAAGIHEGLSNGVRWQLLIDVTISHSPAPSVDLDCKEGHQEA